MSCIIRVLDTQTANKIAAGEVVERPSSVIKELVENAIDAGSTSVTVETRGGGIEYIRVTDNGSGIEREYAETAFLPHATSKLETADDLTHIDTLGFRGEALASIAAVSKVKFTTRRADAESGTVIRIEGGTVIDISETGSPDGTTAEVSELFYNVPARLKFLMSPRTESAYIADYIARMIISYPGVSIRLTQSGKEIYRSSGDGSMKNAIFCVYGAEPIPFLVPVSFDDGYIAICGFCGTEQIAKSNRTGQSFFVNSRYIKSQKLSFALQRAFDTRLMSGRFPFAALCISISSREIDVNVHPNKLDIRFKSEDRVVRAVTSSVRRALDRHMYGTEAAAEPKTEQQAPVELMTKTSETSEPIPKPYYDGDAAAARRQYEIRQRPASTEDIAKQLSAQYTAPKREITVAEPSAAARIQYPVIPTAARADVYIKSEHTKRIAVMPETEKPLILGEQDYSIIGCLFDCYWVIQQGNDVFFVDQHAAHERRLYERYMAGTLASDSQLLLVPVIVKLTPTEHSALMADIDSFTELGFDIEDFGALTVSMRAVPSIMGEAQAGDFLREAISAVMKTGKVSAKELKRGSIIQCACKHAIKAGEQIDRKEAEALLKEYRETGVPMTCPHGRPVMVRMSKLEFEKLFKRIV